MPDAPALVEVGRVTRAHGIRGEVKVDGPPDLLEALEEVTRVFVQPGGADPRVTTRIGDVAGFPAALRQCRMHQGAALLVLDGVPTRNDAEALRGARIHVFGEDLPELDHGEYYAHDLIGLKVVDMDGNAVGELVEVLATGANDVYVVQGPAGERLLPAIESVVKAIDMEEGLLRVVIPEGL
ncbi:MAG: ribosome maturation factor RimM [Thermoflexales bacterium]